MKIHANNKWPITPQELARLSLYHSQTELARRCGVTRSTVRRWWTKYGIRSISGKERYALSTRYDLDGWDSSGLIAGEFELKNDKRRPMLRTKYGSKVVLMQATRALTQYSIGRYIPAFVQVCHVCRNKECTLLEHSALMPPKAHWWFNNGKRDKVPDCLILTPLGTAPGIDGLNCLTGSLPKVQCSNAVSDKEWERFLINCLLEEPILAGTVKPVLFVFLIQNGYS